MSSIMVPPATAVCSQIISVLAIRSRLVGHIRKENKQRIIALSSYCLTAIDRYFISILSWTYMHGTI